MLQKVAESTVWPKKINKSLFVKVLLADTVLAPQTRKFTWAKCYSELQLPWIMNAMLLEYKTGKYQIYK